MRDCDDRNLYSWNPIFEIANQSPIAYRGSLASSDLRLLLGGAHCFLKILQGFWGSLLGKIEWPAAEVLASVSKVAKKV